MTKKLTKVDPVPSMELDLDAFIHSHISSEEDADDDDRLLSVPHRTIDEILNDSDSNSSSSAPQSPTALFQRDYALSVLSSMPSSETPVEATQKTTGSVKSTQLEEIPVSSRPSSFSRVKVGEFSDDPFRRVSRQLPSLFGGVKANVKPGAALAAAAAASRSMPTPHAAAIKSRRASSRSLERILDAEELASAVVDESEEVSDELGSSSGDFYAIGEKLSDEGAKVSNYEASKIWVSDRTSVRDEVLHGTDEIGELSVSKNMKFEAEQLLESQELRDNYSVREEHESSSSLALNLDVIPKDPPIIIIEEELNFHSNRTVFHPSIVKDGNSASASSDEHVGVIMEANPELVSLMSDSDKGETVEADSSVQENFSGSRDNEVDLGREDASSMGDINELVQERIEKLESKILDRRAEKKSKPSMKPLELAEELEKKQASTGLHWEEGAAAQPMRLEGVKRGSTTLGYFNVQADNTISRTISSHPFRRDYGSPQSLAVHANYIAVGMTKGVVIVVPSKYYAHSSDNMDAKMLMLGLQADRSNAAVTSLCFNQLGDLLLAGYGDGHVTVWDVLRASAAKVISGEHTAPVVHTLFLGQDSQVTRQFKVVTGDSKGLVLLHSFSVALLNRFSIKTQCLLDGQKTGTVLSASPLLFDEFSGSSSSASQGNSTVSSGSISSMLGGFVGGDGGWKIFNEGSSLVEEGVVIFVTHQNALVVRLSPSVEIYAQLSKPDGIREGSMPCTAWKCITSSHTSSAGAEGVERVSLLAIAWDRKVQVAKLVKSGLKVYGKWSLESAAIGVAWLDDQMLVILTMSGQLFLFAKDGTMIHQTSFAIDGSGWEDLVAYHTHFINIFGNPEKSYHNCIAVRGASVYVLGPAHLVISRLLPWKERIQVLRNAGDWMGSLNMAMTIYDGQAHGVIDLPRSLEALQEAIMPYLVELLLSYVDEVFSYISVALGNQIEKIEQINDPHSVSSAVHSEIKEQYTRVGGVAVEFCVHIKRTDILFDEIFTKFVAVQQREAFLELLEPYILKDMLGSLPPEIMQALVEHYSDKGWLQRVEQCVLHMDISSLDFNQVVRLCREHGLYGALIYLFNRGLDDFRAPLEELLGVLRNSQRDSALAIGYRMLVYLKYCFSGLSFPPGQGNLAPSRLPSLRTELIKFLLEDYANNSRGVSSVPSKGSYLNLYSILELDTEATLDVLRCAFVEDENLKDESSVHDPRKENMEAGSKNLLVQNVVDALVPVLDKDLSPTDNSTSSVIVGSGEERPLKKNVGYLSEFIAFYVARGMAVVSKSVLSQLLECLISDCNSINEVGGRNIISKRREKQVLALLVVVPENHWDTSYILNLCEEVQFYQVCGLIHIARHQYLAALDSYMKDEDEPIHAFYFINKLLTELSRKEIAVFRPAIISRIPELVNLSREGVFFLVIDHFNDETSHILSELRLHPRSHFLYLKTVVEVYLSGTADFSHFKSDESLVMKDLSKGVEEYLQRLSEFPKILRNNPITVTDDIVECYLELLCQFERESVLKFLETFDSYRVEHCLRLCQQYGIVDATAFLLERVGDVGNALLLTLSSLNEKFNSLELAVESIVSKVATSPDTEHFNCVLKLPEVNDIDNVLHACIVLCQRNTPRLNPEESEILWFKLLDSFCGSLLDSYSNGAGNGGSPAESSGIEKDEEASVINWRISKSGKGAYILKKVFFRFIKEIVEGMIGYIHLPTIMSKLLSDNGSQEFGDFKLTILGMLGTYGFERRILDTAKSLIEDDTFYTMSVLKKGATHGYAPRSLDCCICNCPLTKNSPSSRIRVFNCGHSTHLQCEGIENASTGPASSSGCPLCMPNNKPHRSKNKSMVLVDNAFAKSHPKTQSTSASLAHETDATELAFGSQQISRFEILSKLQKEERVVQVEKLPQLRLAPPAIYHEKVKTGHDHLSGESSNSNSNSNGKGKMEKPIKNRQIRELKVRGSSSLRFPLKSTIFSKERANKR